VAFKEGNRQVKHASDQRGFTLIELMVTLVVLVVLLGVGIPSFNNWVVSTRMDTATMNLAGVLKQARSEAVSRQSVITLAPKAGGWTEGLTMYTDTDAGGNTAYAAANDTLIKDLEFSMGGIAASTSANAAAYISFTSGGLLNEGNNEVEIILCDSTEEEGGSSITVNPVGRTSILKGTETNPLPSCTL
jgi:type IV fimbrial biogenesis protein FimT|tara:strand:- start:569813 stop:570379 length:567 start_codon:yes stop_codon:yes gene_type:complete